MASGLFALLDDVAAIAKVAASTLDDTAAVAVKASAKAAGVVIDDAAVTPRYVVGFAADRELPIVAKIARGSLRNKLVLLLPGALLLSYFLPAAITPLLMAGGAFLCFEGAEKLWEKLFPHDDDPSDDVAVDPVEQERNMVAGAIRTDLILSAEIMAIALGTVEAAPIMEQAAALVAVSLGITALVYGAVALIVKADDAGVHLARSRSITMRGIGRGLVAGMPPFLVLLGWVGLVAMLWVGGHIVIDGLNVFGAALPHELLHRAMHAAEPGGGVAVWFAEAGGSAIFGIALGAAIVAVMHLVPSRRGKAAH
ncbi:DUF808 domain-containing protein [Sandarakinorhabdus sp.]|uniref:DUF808 domain-containing protein n=1 Tax=Sandarakinorhabdus sp. TaxID=1916663 RepID=UPI00286D6D18|nr:DUF808 domain-containing protein [Sandarakinorhabdus sp.]